MRNSHAHSKPLELQLGGALGSLESKAPTFQIAESGDLDGSDRTGDVSMINKRDPLDRACSPKPRYKNTPCSTSRPTFGLAKAKFC